MGGYVDDDDDDYFNGFENVYRSPNGATEVASVARGKKNNDDDYYYDPTAAKQQDIVIADNVVVEQAAGFDGYIESTVDPGPWLLIATCCVCFGFMLIVVPGLLWIYNEHGQGRRGHRRRRRRRRGKRKGDDDTIETDTCCSAGSGTDDDEEGNVAKEDSSDPRKPPTTATSVAAATLLTQVLAWDTETRKILRLAIPYTVSALTTSVFSNTCLILVSMQLGVKPVAAYALVQVLCGLSDGVLQAPIYACTTLCSQAVGAGNPTLAGNNIQLAVFLYMVFQVPVIFFWWYYMYETILFLEWGDTSIAQDAQDFVRVYIFSYTFGGLSSAVWQLLEVTGHAAEGTIINTLWGATNVLLIAGRLLWWRDDAATTVVSLADVAWIYNGTSVLYIGITVAIATGRGWLTPFWKGLIGSTALHNTSAVRRMLRQAIPLAASSFLSNAEWAVLTLLASCLGPAEVAAWALLGSIWDIFYSVTAGIGDAAEIRVAFHLGNGSGSGARLSAYKSLFLGMVVASAVSLLYFSLQNRIPAWFTTDVTLQSMLRELVPFVGVANLTMTFGMQCWSLIGAQGNYKFATWVSCLSSWGICMPLAAIYVFILRLDLQGLTSAVVMGYLATGSALSYKLLSTNWDRQARKIQGQNSDAAMGKESLDSSEEQPFIALRAASSPNQTAGQRKIQLITIPAGQSPCLVLGHVENREGVYVVGVRVESPILYRVSIGDAILSIDGVSVSNDAPHRVSAQIEEVQSFDRHLAVMSSPADIVDDLFADGGCMCWDDSIDSLEAALLEDDVMDTASNKMTQRAAKAKNSEDGRTAEAAIRTNYCELVDTPTIAINTDAPNLALPRGGHHPSDECSETADFETSSKGGGSYQALDGYVMHKATQALRSVDDRCDSQHGDLCMDNTIFGLPNENSFVQNDKIRLSSCESSLEVGHSGSAVPGFAHPHPTSADSTIHVLYESDSLRRSLAETTDGLEIPSAQNNISEVSTDNDMFARRYSDEQRFCEPSSENPSTVDAPEVLNVYDTPGLCKFLEDTVYASESPPIVDDTSDVIELNTIVTTTRNLSTPTEPASSCRGLENTGLEASSQELERGEVPSDQDYALSSQTMDLLRVEQIAGQNTAIGAVSIIGPIIQHDIVDSAQMLYETDSLCRSLEEAVFALGNEPNAEQPRTSSGKTSEERSASKDQTNPKSGSECEHSTTNEELQRPNTPKSWEHIGPDQTTDPDDTTATTGNGCSPPQDMEVAHTMRENEEQLRLDDATHHQTMPLSYSRPPMPEMDHRTLHQQRSVIANGADDAIIALSKGVVLEDVSSSSPPSSSAAAATVADVDVESAVPSRDPPASHLHNHDSEDYGSTDSEHEIV